MVRRPCSISLILVLVVGVTSARAQSREQIWTAARQAKSMQPRPKPPDGFEGFLLRASENRWPQRLFNPRTGPFLTVGLPGDGAGLGAGPAWRLSPVDQRYTATASFAVSAARDWSGQLRLDVPELLPGPRAGRAGLSISAGRHHRADDPFWGLGPEADDRVSYSLSRRDGEAELTLRLSPALRVGLRAGAQSAQARAVRGGPVPTADRLTHVEVGGLLDFDQRNTVPPTRTGRHLQPAAIDGASAGRQLQLAWSAFTDTGGGAYSFQRAAIDARQFVPFLHGHRVLALRVLAVVTSTSRGAQVPFYLMPVLGGSRVGRAYPTFRFRDRHLLAAQAEYRYTINPFMHGAIFVDAAQVAPRLADLTWTWVRWSTGLGLRFGGRGGAGLRFDLAFGRDGARLAVGLGHAF